VSAGKAHWRGRSHLSTPALLLAPIHELPTETVRKFRISLTLGSHEWSQRSRKRRFAALHANQTQRLHSPLAIFRTVSPTCALGSSYPENCIAPVLTDQDRTRRPLCWAGPMHLDTRLDRHTGFWMQCVVTVFDYYGRRFSVRSAHTDHLLSSNIRVMGNLPRRDVRGRCCSASILQKADGLLPLPQVAPRRTAQKNARPAARRGARGGGTRPGPQRRGDRQPRP